MKVFIAAIAGLLSTGAAFAQNGAGTTVSYEGLMTVTAVTSQCTANNTIDVDNSARIVYRYKNSSSDPADAIAIFFPTSTFRLLSSDPSGSLAGAVTTQNVFISGRANFDAPTAGSSNLLIAPTNSSQTLANGVNIRINGTIDNAFFTTGCTMTIRSVLTRRVIQ